jgi:hypothetical protein
MIRKESKTSRVILAHPNCHMYGTCKYGHWVISMGILCYVRARSRKLAVKCIFIKFVPWFTWLVAGLSPRSPGFDYRPVHMIFVVNKVAMGCVFLRLLQYISIDIIPPMFHTHSHVTLTRRTNGRGLGTFQKATLFRKSGAIGQKSTFTFLMNIRFMIHQ